MSAQEQQPADCFICRKHRGEINISGGAIYENDLLYAGHVLPHGESQEIAALCARLHAYLEESEE